MNQLRVHHSAPRLGSHPGVDWFHMPSCRESFTSPKALGLIYFVQHFPISRKQNDRIQRYTKCIQVHQSVSISQVYAPPMPLQPIRIVKACHKKAGKVGKGQHTKRLYRNCKLRYVIAAWCKQPLPPPSRSSAVCPGFAQNRITGGKTMRSTAGVQNQSELNEHTWLFWYILIVIKLQFGDCYLASFSFGRVPEALHRFPECCRHPHFFGIHHLHLHFCKIWRQRIIRINVSDG